MNGVETIPFLRANLSTFDVCIYIHFDSKNITFLIYADCHISFGFREFKKEVKLDIES